MERGEASSPQASCRPAGTRAGRGQSQAARAHADIVAPLSGLVAARHVELGDMAQPGRPLLTVYDPRAMRAVVEVLKEFGARGAQD